MMSPSVASLQSLLVVKVMVPSIFMDPRDHGINGGARVDSSRASAERNGQPEAERGTFRPTSSSPLDRSSSRSLARRSERARKLPEGGSAPLESRAS